MDITNYITSFQVGSNIANYFNKKIGFSDDDNKKANQYFRPNILGSTANNLINNIGERIVAFGVNGGLSLLKYGPTVLKNTPLQYLEKLPGLFLKLSSVLLASSDVVQVVAHGASAYSKGLGTKEGKNHAKIALKYLYRGAIEIGIYTTLSALIGEANLDIVYAEAILNLIAPNEYRKIINALFSFIDNKVIGETDNNNAVTAIRKRRRGISEREMKGLAENGKVRRSPRNIGNK